VEALVQGEERPVNEILNWCRQGPPSARVDKVEEKDVPPETALKEFLRKETE
jgi:acylphosphatase